MVDDAERWKIPELSKYILTFMIFLSKDDLLSNLFSRAYFLGFGEMKMNAVPKYDIISSVRIPEEIFQSVLDWVKIFTYTGKNK